MELQFLRDSLAHEWGDPNNIALQRRIEKHIISARATMIQRRYDTTKIFPESLLITFKIDELEKKDPSSCGCNEGFGLFLKTKIRIPKPLIVKDESYFSFVGSSGFENSFGYIPSHEIDGIIRRKYTSNQVFYTLINDYIYIIGKENSRGIKSIIVKYIPDNPLELLSLGNCFGSCFKDGTFYIEESLVEGITSLIKNRMPKIIQEESGEIEINS